MFAYASDRARGRVQQKVYQGTTWIGFGTSGPTGNAFGVSFPSNDTYTVVVDPFGAGTGTTTVAIS